VTPESSIRVKCSNCNAVLKAKVEWAGKQAKCPKCNATIEVHVSGQSCPPRPPLLATEKQKDYAISLGISFPETISRRDISKLIDEAVVALDEKRFERLDEIDRRETQARNEIRQEILEEIDADDCRLSKATTEQIVEELSERGLAAILITMQWDDIQDFHVLSGTRAEIAFSDDMTQEDVEATIMTLAGDQMKRKGII